MVAISPYKCIDIIRHIKLMMRTKGKSLIIAPSSSKCFNKSKACPVGIPTGHHGPVVGIIATISIIDKILLSAVKKTWHTT